MDENPAFKFCFKNVRFFCIADASIIYYEHRLHLHVQLQTLILLSNRDNDRLWSLTYFSQSGDVAHSIAIELEVELVPLSQISLSTSSP